MNERTNTAKAQPSVEQECCRTCGAAIKPDAEAYPFCSARCRGADLLGWFDGRYKITREIKDSDLETVD